MGPLARMYTDHEQVLEYLSDQKQISHHSTLQTTLPKVLLMAAASEFEDRICSILKSHVREHTSDHKILELVDKKAINRQYHTLFSWETANANHFWSHFGKEFSKSMKDHCQNDKDLAESIRCFMEIGRLRNEMVHSNYAAFHLSKTLADVHDLYHQATRFVEELPRLLESTVEPPQDVATQ